MVRGTELAMSLQGSSGKALGMNITLGGDWQITERSPCASVRGWDCLVAWLQPGVLQPAFLMAIS